MKATPELQLLAVAATVTALMWIPYICARLLTHGPVRALGPDPTLLPDPIWAQRARRAHANAVESLAVFAPLVVMAALIGVSTPATILASKVYLVARVTHYVVYAAGIPVARTVAFAFGFAATAVFAAAVLGS